MHLLYADDSGDPQDPAIDWFVLAGVSVFERQCYWFSEELEAIAARFDPAQSASIELHGAEMRNGKFWRQFPPSDRLLAIDDALTVLAKSNPSNRIFAVAVQKDSVSPADPVDYAFEQLASRFDHYLRRLHLMGDTQRGLIVFDKAKVEKRIQTLASEFRTVGHQWGIVRNFAEVPVFMDSKASRVLQLADLVAYAVFRRFQASDSRFFDIIESRFDASDGVTHGLHVRRRS